MKTIYYTSKTEKNKIIIDFHLPGIKKSEVELSYSKVLFKKFLTNGVTLSVTVKNPTYSNTTVELDVYDDYIVGELDTDNISAKMEDGLLTVEVPFTSETRNKVTIK